MKRILTILFLLSAFAAAAQPKITTPKVITDTIRGLTVRTILVNDTLKFQDTTKIYGATAAPALYFRGPSLSTPSFALNHENKAMFNTTTAHTQSTVTMQNLGNTSSDYVLAFKSSAGTFRGGFRTDGSQLTLVFDKLVGTTGSTFTTIVDQQYDLTSQSTGALTTGTFRFHSSSAITSATAGQIYFLVDPSYQPTAGSNTFTISKIAPTINQASGNTGITRGLYIHPALISAADWRAIEITNGVVLIDTGSLAVNKSSASFNLDVNGTGKVSNTPASSAPGSDSVLVKDASTGQVKTIAPISFLRGSGTLDFPSTSAGTSSDLTITVTGAIDGDVVSIGVPNGSTLSNGCFTAWVSGSNTVTVRFTNNASAGSLDPASGTFKAIVHK